MTMADRIVVMHDGIVEQIGEPLEIYDKPNNMFVAGFIGSPAINLFPGFFLTGDRTVFETDEGMIVPLARAPTGYENRRGMLGIRPEHIAIDPEGAVDLSVTVVEPTGSETFIIGQSGKETVRCLFRDRIALRPGDAVRLRFDPDRILHFDEKTGRRI
jgi:multiple sugar transport system ATP-binding protein